MNTPNINPGPNPDKTVGAGASGVVAGKKSHQPNDLFSMLLAMLSNSSHGGIGSKTAKSQSDGKNPSAADTPAATSGDPAATTCSTPGIPTTPGTSGPSASPTTPGSSATPGVPTTPVIMITNPPQTPDDDDLADESRGANRHELTNGVSKTPSDSQNGSQISWSHQVRTELPPGLMDAVKDAIGHAPEPKPWEPLIVANNVAANQVQAATTDGKNLPTQPAVADTKTPTSVDTKHENAVNIVSAPHEAERSEDKDDAKSGTSDGSSQPKLNTSRVASTTDEIRIDDSTGQIESSTTQQTQPIVRTDAVQAVHVTNVTHVPSSTPIDQLISVITPLQAGPDGSHRITLRLAPENMGTLELRVDLNRGNIDVHIRADSASTGSTLRDSLPDLRAEIEKLGLHAGSFDVQSGQKQDSTAPQQKQHSQRSLDLATQDEEVIQELSKLAQHVSSTSDLDIRL